MTHDVTSLSTAQSRATGNAIGATLVDHYGGDQDRVSGATLVQRLARTLDAAGLTSPTPIPVATLAPLDQFHVGGLQSTVQLAELAQITRGERVIDIGSGLGGPSRYLADAFGCQVLGVDLSPSFVAAAAYLAERAGLADKVAYVCADVLNLPPSARHFDLAWTQHVAMNISDRAALYRSIFDALRPGGRLAVHDIVSSGGAPVMYPVPWAKTEATSFLLTPDEMRSALEQAGFAVTQWIDRSNEVIAWFARQAATSASPTGARQPGLSLAMGDDFPQAVANLTRNLQEHRVGVIQAVLTRR